MNMRRSLLECSRTFAVLYTAFEPTRKQESASSTRGRSPTALGTGSPEIQPATHAD